MRKNLQKLIAIFCLLTGMTNIAKAQPSTAAAYPFSTANEPFVYVSGGTSVSLQGDDVTVQNIPIGFSFPFTTGTYTTVSACTNGWLSIANSSSTTWTNSSGNVTTLGPVMMPLFDDQWGTSGTATFSYITTGTAPNRIFTFEWRAMDFPRLSVVGAQSFQVKLYENGMIKFCYKREPPATSGTATGTIGIGKSATDYLVLNNASSAPTPTSTTFVDNIPDRPATDQVYIFGAPPCPSLPTNVTATNITATKATVSWTNVSAPLGYEYVIDQSSANPTSGVTSTNNTTLNLSGLNPGTSYWAHVRGVCTGISKSAWVHKQFTTTTCVGPNVSMANITAESATAVWNTINIAQRYEYILSQDANPPTSGTSFTTNNTMPLSGLVSGTQYYFHIRSICANNELSDWNSASFNTMLPCVPPTVTVIDFSAEQKKATWQPVPTAVAYEWAVTSNQTPPSLGKNIYTEEVDIMLPPDDGKGYYLHVRTNCVSIFNASEWGTVTLRQPSGTAISNVNMEGMLFNAYPSPVKDVLTINLDGLQQISGNISIADITGKVVYTTPVNAATLEVNMNAMAPGVYFIKYSNQNNTQTIKVNKL